MSSNDNSQILVGNGERTGVPISIHRSNIDNNVLLVGTSGTGKTHLLKNIVNQIGKAEPSAAVFIIDPFKEYGDVAKECSLEVINVEGDMKEFGDKVVFAFDQDPEENLGELISGTLKSIQTRINDLDDDVSKIVVIDESWLLSKIPEGMKVLEALSIDESSNISLLVTSQTDNGISEATLEVFKTLVFFKSEKGAYDNICMHEQDIIRVEELPPGSGLIVTVDQRAYTDFD